ncbi:MAG: adenosine kinase [Candidatus Rokubacteria bacterium]|nr:adenosine kinase [Candidatus Rokubacteria bacterium]
MADGEIDVVGIGNALVDVLAQATDEFLRAQRLTKGAMHLIDEARARQLYDAMPPAIEVSGGSAANTIVGVASFGGRAQYIGKIRNDQLGEVFRHDLRATGVRFDVPAATSGPATGRCLILVTPDAQRTLNTFLGVSAELGPEDVDAGVLARGRILYLEGYLFDPPRAQAAFRTAAEHAHAAGRYVALTLSDPFCVDRHRAAFLDLVEHHVDILLANEAEICSLYQVRDFDAALRAVRGHCAIAALTRSEKGSVIAAGNEVHVIEAHRVSEVVDTTGAGDLYAAGVLLGLSRGLPLPVCGRLGSIAAAEVISHVGARPRTSLAKLATGIL